VDELARAAAAAAAGAAFFRLVVDDAAGVCESAVAAPGGMETLPTLALPARRLSLLSSFLVIVGADAVLSVPV
jgi:hypothetical protein